MFFRAYIVDPSLSSNGHPIGGIKGSLKILQKLVRESQPDKIIVCWDGAGGSKKRKSLKKDYKAGRKPLRLNRNIRNLTENEELENKIWQQTRLMEYMNFMPICQLMFEGVEADDIISHVRSASEFKNWQKVIVSSDKDFFQLLDDSTVLHRPVQKEILNKKNIVEKFGIHPNNFAIARAMAGDKSDNLPGYAGVGLTTVKKRFPFLAEERSFTINDILDYCRDQEDAKVKVYKDVLEKKEILKENYKIMQLYVPLLSAQSKKIIKNSVKNELFFNKTEILKMMIQDGFGEFNWTQLSRDFRRIQLDNE